MDLLNLSKSQFIDAIGSMSKEYIQELKINCDDAYYNQSKNLISDWQYDILYDYYRKQFPGDELAIGCKLRDEEIGVTLPYWMGSMDKMKPTDTKMYEKIKKIAKKYILTDKLDGISCLITKNKEIKLYTRGDGTTGKDITHIAKYVNFIPENMGDHTVRGELVMSKTNFENLSGNNSNARNTVSGIVKAKSLKEGIDYVDFIAYELILDNEVQIPLINQLKFLKKAGFRTAHHKEFAQIPTLDELSEHLRDRRETGNYEIDGIILHSNEPYVRNEDGNPKYALAYKEDFSVQTIVKDVLWNVTKSGLIKPRVEIEPVNLSGALITYASGYNAAYIYNNMIGPGAVIMITRSGEVIPRIMEVVVPAEPKFPTDISYMWNDTQIDIIATDSDDAQHSKQILHFFKTLNMKNVSEATVDRMIDAGFNTIFKILNATVEDFCTLENVKIKMAQKIYDAIHDNLNDVPLEELMAASYIFGHGLGKRKLKILVRGIPDIITTEMDNEFLMARILALEGFQEKTAEKIVQNIDKYREFHKKILQYVTIKNIGASGQEQSLENQKIVMSGFRNAKMKQDIEDKGGSVTTSVSKNTTIVITKDPDSTTAKVQKARELGIEILTPEQFTEKYL